MLGRLCQIGIALSAERNRGRLLERIVLEAKELCHADGGTLYLRSDDTLRFAIMHSDALGLALGGTTGRPIELEPVPLRRADGQPNHANVASHCALLKTSINIDDAYDTEQFDFSGTRRFDREHNYRSKSFLTIPMISQRGEVIGVLQLINAQDATGQTTTFSSKWQAIVESLASQAAVALENQQLLLAQKHLLEAFIKMIAEAIDDKSHYTGGHCRRVPILTEMIAQAACSEQDGPFAEFALDEEQWEELRIAAWLHDCGKITTPVHVMDKASKLELFGDRIGEVFTRIEVLRRDAELHYWRARQTSEADESELKSQLEAAHARLSAAREFLERVNIGAEAISAEDRARVNELAVQKYVDSEGGARPLLSEEEVRCLCVGRGTLTQDERVLINGHIVQTIRMLESLPFPPALGRVPEFAGGHHEKMDGSGYPRGLFGCQLSLPARMIAIADVFEALTAQDRPYKSGKSLSEAMRIMGFMKRDNHIDPELFDLFVRSGVYLQYARQQLPAELIDDVDEAHLLAIVPKPFDMPDAVHRESRLTTFLPEYEALIRQWDPE